MNIVKKIWKHKRFWLMPVLVLLVLLGSLMIFAKGSAVVPFSYRLF